MGQNNPVWVDRRKVYGDVYWLSFFMSTFHMDSIYPGINSGGSQELLLLALQLVLAVRRSAQYIVNGQSRFRRGCCSGYNSICGLPIFHPVINFSDIPPEVSHFDKLFHHKLQASALVGLMSMISMIISPQGFVSLGRIRLNRCWPFKL